jgi:hypothetical protein
MHSVKIISQQSGLWEIKDIKAVNKDLQAIFYLLSGNSKK